MPNKFIFADEAGCFTFKRRKGASRYFILCTLTTEDQGLSHELLGLRRELVLAGDYERDKLHATSDLQPVRDRVFSCLANHEFQVDATILEKSKAQPHITESVPTFYQFSWFYHFKYVGPKLFLGADKILITAASIGSRKTRAAFRQGINNTVQQIAERDRWEVTSYPARIRRYILRRSWWESSRAQIQQLSLLPLLIK
jgi:hypothetical protein